MRAFVLRARAAPVDSRKMLEGVGAAAHTEILAHTLMNALMVAQSHRSDVVVYLVLESTGDYSRTVVFDSNRLVDLRGFHEFAWLSKIAMALDASVGMGKEETREVEAGIAVRTMSFEKLLQELAQSHALYLLDKKGVSINEEPFAQQRLCFVLTDHIPMPKNTIAGLLRLGATKLRLGPTMLFASQCVVLIHHALDSR